VPDLTVRNVPAEVHHILREEANRFHRSMNTIVVQALTEYAEKAMRRKRMASVSAQMDALRESIAARQGLTSDSAELIREDRDR
jgi:antitoxin FitA